MIHPRSFVNIHDQEHIFTRFNGIKDPVIPHPDTVNAFFSDDYLNSWGLWIMR
jgi:hypothetical protein